MTSKPAYSMCFVVALLWACSDPRTARLAGDRPGARPSGEHGSSEFVPLRIAAAQRTVALRAEVAATGAERSQGLMDRKHLGTDAGMLFIYPERQAAEAGFWMHRTRIPLDIAFLDAEGRILAIRAMEPCDSSVSMNCPTYAPGVPCWAALEVNRGFFEANRITVGDRVLPPPGLSFRTTESRGGPVE